MLSSTTRAPQRRYSRRVSIASAAEQPNGNVIDVDRLSYMNTALAALPGSTLRTYFSPVLRLKKNLLMRRRATNMRISAAEKVRMVTDGLNMMAKQLAETAGALLGESFQMDVAAFVGLLCDKADVIAYNAGDILCYPNEAAETLFVYVVLNGSVQVTHYQSQARRTLGGSDRKQYFTSARENIRLCGGGVLPENTLFARAAAEATGDCGQSDAASNVTSAIQRSLKRAVRTVGQPTLQVMRTESLKSPLVFGVAEALGMTPFQCSTCAATVTAAGKGEDVKYIYHTNAMRVRATDVHEALLHLVQRDAHARGRGQLDDTAGRTLPKVDRRVARGGSRQLVDFITAARLKCMSTYFPLNEILMRQSWLLQDTPITTIRNLIACLVPRIYMPGDVIVCPHTNSPSSRQLCFLRRGRILIVESPRSSLSPRKGVDVPCACSYLREVEKERVREVVDAGASFGELSVLFGEPRGFTLRADTVCDVWCLPHHDFTSTMRRDDALRRSLVEKAGALRTKWMGEQRFTPSLAELLRNASELLRPLPEMVLRLIQERIEPVVYSPGVLVTSTSRRCEGIIFIIRGRVGSLCEGVASYGPGDVLGEGCLVPHRWPFGLAARCMVEGWRLSREKLLEALERADLLHQHSGEVTSQAHLYMQQIFAEPVPPVKVDIVGRQQMPIVGPPPCGSSYPHYARIVSEIQLKALCFLYRHYIKWEDINYATMECSKSKSRIDNPESLDAAARRSVLRSLRKSTGGGQATADLQEGTTDLWAGVTEASTNVSATCPVTRAEKSARHSGTGEAGRRQSTSKTTGRATPSRLPPVGCHRCGRSGKKRRANTGISAFLLNSDVTSAPFVQKGHRLRGGKGDSPCLEGKPLARGGRGQSTNLGGAGDLGGGVSHLRRSASVIAATLGSARSRYPLPPCLNKVLRTLHERDHAMSVDAHDDAVRDSQRAAKDRRMRAGLLTRHAGAGDDAGRTVSAPVHLLLCGDPPRADITLEEALAIGYVLQLPDTQAIQACVSFVDPDVTIGLPAHRARRHEMSTTPNDRFHKHNFLFAAAILDDEDRLEEELAEQHRAETEKCDKAQKLMTMLRSQLPVGSSFSPLSSVVGGGAFLETGHTSHQNSPLRERSPLAPAAISSGSPLPGSRGNSISGPAGPGSSFTSPSRPTQVKDDASLQLLCQDPVKALDLLHAKHSVHWSSPHAPHDGGEGDAHPRQLRMFARLRAAAEEPSGDAEHHHSDDVVLINTSSMPEVVVAAHQRTRRQRMSHTGTMASSPTGQDFLASTVSGRAYPQAPEMLPPGTLLFVEGYGVLGSTAAMNTGTSVLTTEGGQVGVMNHTPIESGAGDESSALFGDQSFNGGLRGRTDGCEGGVVEEHLSPKDFVMPSVYDAELAMQRIQRNIEGLNAAAKEQTDERERLLKRQQWLGPHTARVDAALSRPSADEAHLLDDWATSYRLLQRDPLCSIEVPKALEAHAGPNYLLHGISEHMRQDVESVPRVGDAGVEAWQEQLHHTGLRENIKDSDRPTAQRVRAVVGTSQFGFAAAPLVNPTAHMDSAAYQRWVHEREIFFATYARQLADRSNEGILQEPLFRGSETPEPPPTMIPADACTTELWATSEPSVSPEATGLAAL